MLKFLEEKKENIVVLDDVKDIEKAKHYGIAELNDNHKIISFEEKTSKPKSTLAETACYIFTNEFCPNNFYIKIKIVCNERFCFVN